MDDSLTNLQWLQNFSILSAHPERRSSSDDAHGFSPNSLLGVSQSPSSPPAGDTAASGVPRNSVNNHITSSASANMSSGRYLQQATERLCRNSVIRSPEEIDYKENYRVKPPYSYATLIFMAMQASNKTKITLSAIYSWITENFPYYRHAEPSWQNSIRHNLSLNKCFMKVARTKDEPGKGGFWQIDPQYADMFADGVFKRKRTAAAPHAAPRRRNGKTTPKQGHRHRYPSQKRVTGSSLLTTQAIEREVFLDGISHWTSGFADIATSSCSRDNFKDLDVNMALSGLSCGSDASLEGHPLGADGRMSTGSRTMGAGLACGYMEVSDSVGEHFSLQPAGTQAYPPFHPPQYKELVPFSPQQPHIWEESRDELQPVSLAADHSFGCSEGFFTEAPWEGSWSLACDL